MTEQYPQGIWDASEYFEHLTATNRLAYGRNQSVVRIRPRM